ncbi:MAG: nucleotidyltransferase family protein [Alphaproteobacteria bacterium]|nr:nucleotidyltransferase family protein [Alphaproteobacteria bacterium]
MKVDCIVLAAGLSRRFGETDKLMAEVGGKPLIWHAATCALNARCNRVVVVIGRDGEQIISALDGLAVTLCPNPVHDKGIGSSISAGVASLPAATDGVLILPADMPWMQSDLIDRLISVFAAAGGKAVVYPTTAGGEQRNPVLWPRSEFRNLVKLNADQGARGLIAGTSNERIEVLVADDRIFRDIDSPHDLPG